MPRKPLQAPFNGVTDASTFIGQPGTATDPDALRNMVPRNSRSGRRQLATRPGARSEFAGAAYSGRVNAIGTIARSSGVSSVGTTNPTHDTAGDGSGVYSGKIRGQACVLEADRSIRFFANDSRGTSTVQPPTATVAPGYGAFQACWHATNPNVGFFTTIATDTTNGDSGGKVVIGLNRVDTRSRAFTAQNYAVDHDPPVSLPTSGTNHLFSNHIAQIGGYLFVAANNYVYAFRQDTLAFVNRHSIDWCDEVQALATVTYNGSDYLITAATGNTTVAGPVVSDSASPQEWFGQFYRSAIAVHRINYADTAKNPLGSGGTVLTRRAMPMGLHSTDAGYEDHRTLRPSEYSAAAPRGCLIFAMAAAVDADNQVFVYIARTNQGFGYDGSQSNQKPDGTGPYISCCRANITAGFSTTGAAYASPTAATNYGMSSAAGGWERDTDSLRRSYTWNSTTYYNDIPPITSGGRNPQIIGNEPTFWAVAVDQGRNRVYFAGRRSLLSGAAPTIYAFEADTGNMLWFADCGGTIQQNGITVDPTTGNVLCACVRNHRWTKPDGSAPSPTEKAEVIELNGETGQTVGTFDLSDTVDYNLFTTAANSSNPDDPSYSGLGAYAVAVNSRGQALVALAPYRYCP